MFGNEKCSSHDKGWLKLASCYFYSTSDQMVLIFYRENLPCTAGQKTSFVSLHLNFCIRCMKGKFAEMVFLIYFKGKINEKCLFDLFKTSGQLPS
jgi:hypothetical protein